MAQANNSTYVLVCFSPFNQLLWLGFSGVEHQKADWLGIHEKICQNLIPLRQSAPFLPSEEERQNRERQLQTKKAS